MKPEDMAAGSAPIHETCGLGICCLDTPSASSEPIDDKFKRLPALSTRRLQTIRCYTLVGMVFRCDSPGREVADIGIQQLALV